MRILALDIGKKRVGLALSDPLQIIASPHSIITFRNEQELITKIIQIINEQTVWKLVVGLPINQQSQIQVDFTHKITTKLQKQLPGNFPIVFQDESFSSKQSQEILNQYQKKKIAKKHLDDIAASIILKRYLEQKNNDY